MQVRTPFKQPSQSETHLLYKERTMLIPLERLGRKLRLKEEGA